MKTADDVIAPRPTVVWFAQLMEGQLTANDHKRGWDDCSPRWLLHRLKQETAELERAIKIKAPAHVITAEAADVANFAMMIADVRARLAAERGHGSNCRTSP